MAIKIKKLPKKISELVGGYDFHLQKKADMGVLGQTELRCYNRFLDDLEKSKDPEYPYFFDDTEVKRVLAFTSLLVKFNEKGDRVPLQLYAWQKFVVLNLFGWRHKHTKMLRFREAYISVARRNGKSALSSVLLHYFMVCSSFRSERAICFSVKKDSAFIVFRQFLEYIDADPDLDELYNYSKINGNASCLGTDNYLEVFAGSTDADGFQSGFAIGDEIALQSGELYTLISDGQANLAQSLLIGISTAGFDIGGWCHTRYKSISKDLKAKNLADTLFVYVCEPDPDDNFADSKTWAKSNPLLFFDYDCNLRQDKIDYYKTKYQEALTIGNRKLTSFLTKQCNYWVAQQDTMLCNIEELMDHCMFDFSFEDVMALYKKWYLGIDLAQTLDLNSVAFLTWIKVDNDENLLPPDSLDGNKKIYINVHSFIPEKTLQRHIDSDKFAYNLYVNKELFLTSGGNGLRTDHSKILEHIQNLQEKNELTYKTIAYDPYGMAVIEDEMAELCEWFIAQPQGAKHLSPYIEYFQAYVMSHEIAISRGSSDIFLKAVRNSVVSQKDDGFCFVTKPTGQANANYRIDPIDAMLNGIIAPIKDKVVAFEDSAAIIDNWLDLYNS